MDHAAKFTVIARESMDFLRFTQNFCLLSITSPIDDETLKSLSWIGANYYHPVDLPDTSELNWRDAIIRCLESVYPRSRTQEDTFSNS